MLWGATAPSTAAGRAAPPLAPPNLVFNLALAFGREEASGPACDRMKHTGALMWQTAGGQEALVCVRVHGLSFY